MRNFVLFTVLALMVLASFVLNLAWGSVAISGTDLMQTLVNGPSTGVTSQIIWELRLPRALTAIFAGMSLALSGLVMQTVFRNPLAGPFVLGVSSGASLGVALVLLLGFGGLGLLPAATVGSIAVMALVVFAARWTASTVNLLVIGLMMGYMVDSLVSLMIHFGDPDRLSAYVGWGFGSFGRCRFEDLTWFSSLTFLGVLALTPSLKFLNAILLGEDNARSLGFSVVKHRVWVLAVASMLAAVVTVYCGPIGFLGLVVPHLARHFFRTSNHRVLIPAVLIVGAILALLSGWFANLPTHGGSLPLNAITALLGGPVVFWAMLKNRRSFNA